MGSRKRRRETAQSPGIMMEGHPVPFVRPPWKRTFRRSSVRPCDPFPFPFLTMTVSLEATFLALFVLASQNRLARHAATHAAVAWITDVRLSTCICPPVLDTVSDD